MLKTMKLLLAAAFLLAGLSLAGCKNCKEENNSSANSDSPPNEKSKKFCVYFVDKKTGKSLIGNDKDQIPFENLDITLDGYHKTPRDYYGAVRNPASSMDTRTGRLIIGPIEWGWEAKEEFGIRFLVSPKRLLDEIPPCTDSLLFEALKRAEIIDDCNSNIWVEYAHFKIGAKPMALQQKYKGNGLTDTLRIEVER